MMCRKLGMGGTFELQYRFLLQTTLELFLYETLRSCPMPRLLLNCNAILSLGI